MHALHVAKYIQIFVLHKGENVLKIVFYYTFQYYLFRRIMQQSCVIHFRNGVSVFQILIHVKEFSNFIVIFDFGTFLNPISPFLGSFTIQLLQSKVCRHLANPLLPTQPPCLCGLFEEAAFLKKNLVEIAAKEWRDCTKIKLKSKLLQVS